MCGSASSWRMVIWLSCEFLPDCLVPDHRSPGPLQAQHSRDNQQERVRLEANPIFNSIVPVCSSSPPEGIHLLQTPDLAWPAVLHTPVSQQHTSAPFSSQDPCTQRT